MGSLSNRTGIRRGRETFSLCMCIHWGKAMWTHSEKVAVWKLGRKISAEFDHIGIPISMILWSSLSFRWVLSTHINESFSASLFSHMTVTLCLVSVRFLVWIDFPAPPATEADLFHWANKFASVPPSEKVCPGLGLVAEDFVPLVQESPRACSLRQGLW